MSWPAAVVRRSGIVCTDVRRVFSPCLLVASLVATTGCSHGRVPPAPLPFPYPHEHGLAAAGRLQKTVQALVDAGTNLERFQAARRRVSDYGLTRGAWVEPIDWWTFQDNLVIDLPGKSPELVYVIAHYDRSDASPLAFLGHLTNGLADPLVDWATLSDGAIDNATGVAVALEIAAALRKIGLERSYRVLLTGASESGLRGARAHVARMSDDDFGRLALAIELHAIGADWSRTCVLGDVSDRRAAKEAIVSARNLGMSLHEGESAPLTAGDYEPFASTSFGRDLGRGLLYSGPLGILPQRSWFTDAREVPVLVVSSCQLMDGADYAARMCLFPSGRYHGAGDAAERVDIVRLYELTVVLLDTLAVLESQARAETK